MLGTSARQMEAGSWKTLVYFQGASDQKLKFELTDNGICSGHGATAPQFACGQTGEVKLEGDAAAVLVKAVRQVSEQGFQLYALAGAGDYSIKQGTSSIINGRALNRGGFLSGVGAKAVIWPDTLVAPAIALDASLGWQRYYGQMRLDILQYQLALEASHRFVFDDSRWVVEPYGGIKWLRSHAWLKNIGSGERVGGIQDTVTPFLGLNLPVFGGDAIFAEASFVNGIQYSGGLVFKFGPKDGAASL